MGTEVTHQGNPGGIMKRAALPLVLFLLVLGPVPGRAEVVPPCPVVTDPAGDAGREPGQIHIDDSSARAVDILSAGARSTEETLEISIRVTYLGARPPGERDFAYWGVSWNGLHAARWVASAHRATDGAITFGYGAWGKGSSVTSGTFDLATSTIRIFVPRAAVSSPPDGGAIDGFRAAAEMLLEIPEIGALILAADSTSDGRYVLGTDCGA